MSRLAAEWQNFNPRPPWGGRRSLPCPCRREVREFQSTPSVGRATCPSNTSSVRTAISIHALRGEGDEYDGINLYVDFISIHALRGEGDLYRLNSVPYLLFQSTPSVGRATTAKNIWRWNLSGISIHALRGEGDVCKGNGYYYVDLFQSTPSVGRATIQYII